MLNAVDPLSLVSPQLHVQKVTDERVCSMCHNLRYIVKVYCGKYKVDMLASYYFKHPCTKSVSMLSILYDNKTSYIVGS